jgi:hypothetical protein
MGNRVPHISNKANDHKPTGEGKVAPPSLSFSSKTTSDAFFGVPLDLLASIFTLLPPSTSLQLSLVSSGWYEASSQAYRLFWTRYKFLLSDLEKETLERGKTSWKLIFWTHAKPPLYIINRRRPCESCDWYYFEPSIFGSELMLWILLTKVPNSVCITGK